MAYLNVKDPNISLNNKFLRGTIIRKLATNCKTKILKISAIINYSNE